MKQNKPKSQPFTFTEEQVKQIATAPVYDLVIRLDTRTMNIVPAVIGGKPPYEMIYAVLDQVKEFFHQQEVAEYQQKIQELTPKEEVPALEEETA